jgi:acyl-CoA dehydrogenase
MRTVGRCQLAIDMMVERALSRRAQGTTLAEKQLVQAAIADSTIALAQLRLLVLETARIIDTQPHGAARHHIAMCKVAMADVYHDIVRRAIQVHGSLGMTIDTPLAKMWTDVLVMGMADGPTEVHKVAVAKHVLRQGEPAPGPFPTSHLPTRRAAALAARAALVGERV